MYWIVNPDVKNECTEFNKPYLDKQKKKNKKKK